MFMFNVESFFNPIDTQEYFNNHFEKSHLLIKRNSPDFYNSLITFNDIEEVLFSQKLNAPSFRLVDSKTATFPKVSTFCKKDSNVIDPIKYIKGYADGHTLAMGGFQLHSFSLRKFCYDLEKMFGHPFQTNLYLTPEDSKGFSPHWDTHDVFVLQISGKKHWCIYENSVALADKNLEFEKEGFDPGKVIDEFLLEQGDMLYIPRGLTHDAYTSNDKSLHITTGMLGFTWSQFVIEAILKLSKEHSEFREFIPTGSLKSSAEITNDKISKLIQILTSELTALNGIKRFNAQLKSSQNNCSTNQLNQVLELKNLSENTNVVCRQDVHFEIEENYESIILKFYDTLLKFPKHCSGVIKELLNRKKPILVKELTGELDSDGKIVLIRTLIKEGLVKMITQSHQKI